MELTVSEHWRCVIWEVELPRVDRDLRSPDFFLNGCKMALNLRGYCNVHLKKEAWDLTIRISVEKVRGILIHLVNQRSGELEVIGGKSISNAFSNFELIQTLYGTQLCNDYGIGDHNVTFLFVFDFNSEQSIAILKKTFKDISKIQSKMPDIPSNESCFLSLSEDMGKLFDNAEHSDVVLKCGDRKFSANKNILSVRSDVFSAMFKSQFSENETGVVNIQDMEPSVLEQFLRYLYTGRLDSLTLDLAFDLYKAGDKYAVSSLQRKCSSFMANHLSEDNVCNTLILADTYRDADLLEDSISFVASRDVFLRSTTWNAFASDHPAVAVKVYQKFHCK